MTSLMVDLVGCSMPEDGIVVSIDLPGHGDDRRSDEIPGCAAWCDRNSACRDKGSSPISCFIEHAFIRAFMQLELTGLWADNLRPLLVVSIHFLLKRSKKPKSSHSPYSMASASF